MSPDPSRQRSTRISGEDARRSWDESADAWNEFVEDGLDVHRSYVHGPALLEACLPVRGARVLDLGCGQGWFSRQLAGAGASVTALDWSPRLIEHARAHEAKAPLGIEYRVLDAAELGASFAPGSFELVTACMAVADMPDPIPVLAAAARVLTPAGRIVFSVPNPVTDSPHRAWRYDEAGRKVALEIDRYFDAPSQVLQWTMARLREHFATVQYRYTLEDWSCAFEEAGLVIRRLREPRPSAETLAALPQLSGAARVPYFLIFELVPEPRWRPSGR